MASAHDDSATSSERTGSERPYRYGDDLPTADEIERYLLKSPSELWVWILIVVLFVALFTGRWP